MSTARKTTRDLRIANTRLVLAAIHREGPISAARLSERCGLRPSTISNILKQLGSVGAVRSCGHGQSTKQGGKRPLLLDLDPSYGWLAGVEIGASGIRLAIRDFALGSDLRVEIEHTGGAEEALCLAADRVEEFLAERGRALRGFGVAVESGAAGELEKVVTELELRFGCPLRLDRRAAVAACGEWLLGNRGDLDDLVWLGLEPSAGGWSAEAGLVLDGRLHPGGRGRDLALPATGGGIEDLLRLVRGLLDPELIVVDGGPEALPGAAEGGVMRSGFGSFAVAEGGVAMAFEEALEQAG